MTIPKTARAAVTVNGGTPQFSIDHREDFPVPTPGPGEILLECKYTGVCQSDYHAAYGDWQGLTQAEGVTCLGHEGAGIVRAVGPGVTDFKVGDRAGALVAADSCGTCEFCSQDDCALCAKINLTGFHRNGSFAQYINVNTRFAVHIPEGIPFEQAAPFMCSGGTAYTAVKTTGLKAGQTVAVLGAAGGVGHMVVQFAKARGLRVIAIDVGADKKEATLATGADEYVDITGTKDLPATVAALTPDGLGVHGVIVTAGNGKAYAAGVGILRPRGVFVCVGLPPTGSAIAGAEPAAIIFKAITVRGSLLNTVEDMNDALQLLKAGKIKEHVEIRPFAATGQALADVGASKTKGRVVIDFAA
ncbi:Alcohol dehydrogenase 1 [Vanrija pseudolonga]|uniref:Alcohol dehydrogenase 1 n=1 Tax=Vanrija pseudolonga TaxID=143232 RepID=A0AAF0YDA6_9TREE|nr:Alcohol dehydrogenase 1 [Vanrija pseudolonga]